MEESTTPAHGRVRAAGQGDGRWKGRLNFLAPVLIGAACLASPAYADLLLAGFSADTIYRYDGVSATPFATDASMDGPTAMVYDASGDLLVLNEFSHNVLKFDGATGAFMSTFISSATLGGAGVLDPADMELGSDGELYIMGHFNDGGNMVHKFDGLTGAYIGVFAGPGPMRHQHGLAFGPGGNLYQGNVDSGLIEKFDGATGAPLGTLTSVPLGAPIGDLASGPTKLFVTSGAGGGVARYDAVTGAADGFIDPAGSYWGILVDSGYLYLSNLGTGMLRKFDATTSAFISDTFIGGGAFDIIAMPTPVAEPTTGLLLAVGAAVVLGRCSARRRPR